MKKLRKLPLVKIPLDGGVCSAKTSMRPAIASRAADWGFKMVFVPEAAREYFRAVGRNEDPMIQQLGIMNLQLAHETLYVNKAHEYQAAGHQVLVVYDRSLLTGKAYVNDRQWKEVLRRVNLTEKDIVTRYTNPIHLVTAADGALQYYTNDPERPETPEQAIAGDRKLQTIWNGLADHPYHIPNRGDLVMKIDDTWNAVLDIMGLPVPVEDEQWFSIDDTFDPNKIPAPVTRVYIEQDYLTDTPHIEERVRMKQLPDGSRMLFFTEKRPGAESSKRIERERFISPLRYKKLLARRSKDHQTVKKYRYCFVHNCQYFELDEFLDPIPRWGKYKLEYSRTLKNRAVDIPNFIPALDDVTGNPDFKTSTIAKRAAMYA